MAYEVVTTPDKAKRDQLFQELRSSDNPLERQVVKFSGSEEVIVDGKPFVTGVQYGPTGRLQFRPVHRSTWSVAYPTN